MPEPIFTDYRRDLIARTAADLLKILFAAALASRFFQEFPTKLKVGIWVLTGILAVITLFGCPMKKPKE